MRHRAEVPTAFRADTGRMRHALVALTVTALAFLVFTAQASAAKSITGYFGNVSGTSSAPGEFDAPGGIAVNATGVGGVPAGTIYVVDGNNRRVQRFTPTPAGATLERIWGWDVVSSGPGNDNLAPADGFEICVPANGDVCAAAASPSGSEGGQLSQRDDLDDWGIALDPAGNLYVADADNLRIQKFDPDGNFLLTFGADVKNPAASPASSADWEVCTAADYDTGAGGIGCRIGVYNPAPEGTGAGFHNRHFPHFPGATDGRLGHPTTDPSGNVYVPDRTGHRVLKFDSSGSFLRSWGWNAVYSGPGNSPDQVNEVQVVTWTGSVHNPGPNAFVQYSMHGCPACNAQHAPGLNGAQVQAHLEAKMGAGNVTVTGPAGGPWTITFTGVYAGENMSQFFDPSTITVTVKTTTDGASGPEICIPANGDICRVSSGNAGLGGFDSTNSQPSRLVTDATGHLYAVDGDRVQRFDSSGANPIDFAPDQLTPDLAGGGRVSALAYDPVADRLLFLKPPNANGGYEIKELDMSGALQDTHIVGSGVESVNGLALDSATGRMYLSSENYSDPPVNAHRVYVIEDGTATAATAQITPPTAIGESGATFHGTVNPNGFPPARYRFEYSRNGVDWTPASANIDIGEGTADIPVSATVTGLTPSTFYRVRIVVTKLFGGPGATSPELTFLTDTLPPTVTTLSSSQRHHTSASIYGRVNPNGQITNYHFDWGETSSYDQRIPVTDLSAGAGTDTKQVSAQLTGLEPDTTYHYRLVAENPEGVVAGQDATVTTRPLPTPPPSRAYEMVTSPLKATRAVEVFNGGPNLGVPSLDGERIAWTSTIFPLSEDVQAPGDGDNRLFERTPSGWVSKTMNTLRAFTKVNGVRSDSTGTIFGRQDPIASSADLTTLAWAMSNPGELIESAGLGYNQAYIRRDGTGLNGFTAWIENTDTQGSGGGDAALINDEGTAMVRWSIARGLADDANLPGDEDPSNNQQLAGESGGRTIYIVRADHPDDLPTAPKDLVNECTGSLAGGEATLIPARLGTGAATDTLGTQPCAQGKVTSVAGAELGAVPGATFGAPSSSMSNDGRRTYFTTPDSNASTSQCSTVTAAATRCPAQVFLRQYDSSGEPTVRWISRAQGVGPQQIAELGPAIFQGASRDGRFVYFKTNSPLLSNDPNGGDSITTGSASTDSWDLYRYELPPGADAIPGNSDDLDADPADGTLERISGGPAGTADPNTNQPNGLSDSPLRYLSDDGKRAYFLTTSPIAAADTTPSQGGSTVPGGASGNSTTRNLYLFDDTGTAPVYRFIASIPYGDTSSDPTALNKCASSDSNRGGHLDIGKSGTPPVPTHGNNCFRGTRDGRYVVFFTPARLTADDDDDAGDIYLYDAEADELIRVTAPPPGAVPYFCNGAEGNDGSGSPRPQRCNGDLGTSDVGGFSPVAAAAAAGRPGAARGSDGGRTYNVAEDAAGVVSIYFETKSRFLPEDANGEGWDVYQWREGELSLISPGTPASDSWYSGSSLDGEDVFILTSARIDPREIDDSDHDIYDARIGGGFPYTPPPTPCDVLAHQCRGPASSASAPTTPVTAGFNGPGNVGPRAKPKRCRKGLVRREGKCVKRKGSKQRGSKRAGKTGRAGR